MAELKPCPFCGWGTIVLTYSLTFKTAVRCNCCEAQTKYYRSEKEAVKAWNRRVNDEHNNDDPAEGQTTSA